MRRGTSAWRPILVALSIWFAHFMVCWAASELIWPQQRAAHLAAAGATLIALAALILHGRGLHATAATTDTATDTGWMHRFARRATALAATGVIFSALPALVLLP